MQLALTCYHTPMTATEEALRLMAKAEEAWDKLAEETVTVSGQFQKECEELQKELKKNQKSEK